MKDKIVVITGSTSGIGRAAAIELARKGAHLVMVVRNAEKAEKVKKEIADSTGNSRIDIRIADLSLVKEVKRVATEIRSNYPKIDVLINNAGMIYPERIETKEGNEMTLALNHLAYFIMTRELLPGLKGAGKARIINVASEAQRAGKIWFDDIQLKNGYSAMKAYCQSKLMNIMFTYELARQLNGTGITANALHPGVVDTGFARDYKGIMGWLVKASKPFMRSAEKGAETTVYLASHPDVEGKTGIYFSNKKPIRSNSQSYNQEAQRRLWELTEELGRSI